MGIDAVEQVGLGVNPGSGNTRRTCQASNGDGGARALKAVEGIDGSRAIMTFVVTVDDIVPATLVGLLLSSAWRHDLYRSVFTDRHWFPPLHNALGEAARTAPATPDDLRAVVEVLIDENREDLADDFVYNPAMTEEYLLDLCDRGVLLSALGHRRGPRSLLQKMCDVHAYPEAILTLGLDLYCDPAVTVEELADFLARHHDNEWLLRTLAQITPAPLEKQTVYASQIPTGSPAASFHARHLAEHASADLVQAYLDKHPQPGVLILLLDTLGLDAKQSELIETRARDNQDSDVAEAAARRQRRHEATHDALSPPRAVELAASADPEVLLLLANNPRCPYNILEQLAEQREIRFAKQIRATARTTLLSKVVSLAVPPKAETVNRRRGPVQSG